MGRQSDTDGAVKWLNRGRVIFSPGVRAIGYGRVMTRELGRREFIQGAAVVSAGIAVGCGTSSGTSETGGLATDGITRKKIAIVGAGMAGLSAAVDLAGLGYDVTVYEGSDSVGGRIRTTTFGDNGPSVDVGAACVDPSQKLALALFSQFNVTTRNIPLKDYTRYFVNGAQFDGTAAGLLGGNQLNLTAIERQSDGLGALLGNYDTPRLTVDQETSESLRAWATSLQGSYENHLSSNPNASADVANVARLFRGARASELTAAMLVGYPIEPLSTVRTTAVGGMSALPKAMVTWLDQQDNARVQTSAPAISLERDESGGPVLTVGGQNAGRFGFDYVLLAIPVPQMVTLANAAGGDPFGLKQALVDAGADRVTMMPQLKTAYLLNGRGWLGTGSGQYGYVLSADNRGDRAFFNPTAGAGANHEIVTAVAAGAKYNEWGLSDGAREQKAIRNLDSAFPGAAGATSDFVVYDWTGESLIGGGYHDYVDGAHWAKVVGLSSKLHGGRIGLAGDGVASGRPTINSAIESAKKFVKLVDG